MSYFSPNDLSQALDLLVKTSDQLIAGGTDVYPATRPGAGPDSYIDITRIDGLGALSHDNRGTRIGAAVRWCDVIRADLPAAFDGLKQAARQVGSVQIQNAATVVGNICNASPAADGVPPLLALDATVELASAARGVRTLTLEQFIKGVRQTARAPDEMVTAIVIPPQPKTMTSAFEKLGSRQYLVISICMTSAHIVLDDQGVIAQARIAVGACSAVAQRLCAFETRLIGQAPAQVTVTDADLSPLSPIDDVRGSASYRRDVVKEHCLRAIRGATA